MIPTYNCAGFLRQALASVLAQDEGADAMQIEVIDDCSTADDPESVVREIGGSRVTFVRQPENVGHIATFNTCLARARGHLVHVLHGDDFVRPAFYRTLGNAFDIAPEIGAGFCRYAAVNANGDEVALGHLLRASSGILDDWLNTIARGQLLQMCSIVVRRETYEHVGGFDRRINRYGEDWEMWVRIASHCAVWYEVEALACYRVHTSGLSGSRGRLRANMDDLRTVMGIIREHFPPGQADEVVRTAHRHAARAMLRRAARLVPAGDHHFPGDYVREAFRFDPSPATAARTLLFVLKWTAQQVRSRLTWPHSA
jgi:glycosyltransferase involved in cell wall biosynthesis